MVEELSHVKQLSLNHMCKIGLEYLFGRYRLPLQLADGSRKNVTVASGATINPERVYEEVDKDTGEIIGIFHKPLFFSELGTTKSYSLPTMTNNPI
jgi:hypothetical protein